MMFRMRGVAFGLLLAGLVPVAACARTPGRAPESAPRIADSAPEKIAAQRAAMPGLRLEEDAQRWGVEEDRARRDAAASKKKASPAVAPAATGPVDLKKQRAGQRGDGGGYPSARPPRGQPQL
jgi:hypothetical protein